MNEIIQLSSWQASGLSDDERGMLNELLMVWQKHLARNVLKHQYYDMKNTLKDMGIAIPPSLRDFEMVVGWPAKAVDYLADRSIFDGFRFRSGTNDELDNVLRDNDFKNLYAETLPSVLISSPGFFTVTKGGPGDPDVLISAYDCRTGAGLWDYRRRRLKAGMCIADVEEKYGFIRPTQVNLYTNEHVVEMYRSGNGRWTSNRKPHKQGRPLMEVLRYKPTIARPFGRSRINRAVMATTDKAVREALRAEVAAEFAASPQKYIMGADDDLFASKSRWETYIGNIIALTTNEEGENPDFGQLPQASMQPHTEYKRDLAAEFSGETSVPISALGVIHDNPASAEAMYAAKEDLVICATNMNNVNGVALERMGKMVLAILHNTTVDDLTDDEKTITASWHNPAMPSAVSQSDAIIKQVSAFPFMAESTVALEELGYNEDPIMRLESDRERYNARQVLEAARFAAQQTQQLPQRQTGISNQLSQMASQRPKQVKYDSTS